LDQVQKDNEQDRLNASEREQDVLDILDESPPGEICLRGLEAIWNQQRVSEP
jgi:hypothetical protein